MRITILAFLCLLQLALCAPLASSSKPPPQTCKANDRLVYAEDGIKDTINTARRVLGDMTHLGLFYPRWAGQNWINFNIIESVVLAQSKDLSDIIRLGKYLWVADFESKGTDDWGWQILMGLAYHEYKEARGHDHGMLLIEGSWLDALERDFQKHLVPYWDNSTNGGGVLWKIKGDKARYRATISTELYFSIAAKLYSLGRNPDYYKAMAIKAFDWLYTFPGLRENGMFFDGYHEGSISEELYTYNQGVILSGLGYLYKGTKNETYLNAGVDLINAVKKLDAMLGKGLAYNEILADACDVETYKGLKKGDSKNHCSEDQSYFKGAFMKHMRIFLDNIPKSKANEFRVFVQKNSDAAYSAALNNSKDQFSNNWIASELPKFGELSENYKGGAMGMAYDMMYTAKSYGMGC